jgi:hypothetical protein
MSEVKRSPNAPLWRDIDSLRHQTVGQLRVKYLEVFRQESRSNNQKFLVRRLAWRLQANAEGGLSERAAPRRIAWEYLWCNRRGFSDRRRSSPRARENGTEPEPLVSQEERDKLEWLKRAKDGVITQREAARKMGVTDRWVRKLLQRMKKRGDKVVVHGLRDRASNRKIASQTQKRAIEVLKRADWHDFGPTFASEQLAKRHQIRIGKETLRGWMIEAGLWKPGARRIEEIHCWRPRRCAFGELVQWDTSEHDWLEGRGPVRYLVRLIDDATSWSWGRFVERDATAFNMPVLWEYLGKTGGWWTCMDIVQAAEVFFDRIPAETRDQALASWEGWYRWADTACWRRGRRLLRNLENKASIWIAGNGWTNNDHRGSRRQSRPRAATGTGCPGRRWLQRLFHSTLRRWDGVGRSLLGGAAPGTLVTTIGPAAAASQAA